MNRVELYQSRIGKRYKYLKIIEIDMYSHPPKCVCECVCGNIVKLNFTDVCQGEVKTCGCGRTNRRRKKSKNLQKGCFNCGKVGVFSKGLCKNCYIQMYRKEKKKEGIKC